MAGIVQTLFGEKYKRGDDYLNAVIRGASPVSLFSGMTDLAALPFTLTGVLDPKNVVGGTRQMEGMGLLPPDPEGVGPEIVEMGIGMASPGGIAKGINKAFGVADAMAPGAFSRAPAVPIPKAQRERNFEDLAQMERMKGNAKFSPRIKAIEQRTAAAIKQEAQRITPTSRKLTDEYLGSKMQNAFRKFMDRKEAVFVRENNRDFAKALAGGRDHITIPPSDVAIIELRDWIKDKASRAGTSKDERRAYRQLYRDARKMVMGEMSLGVMKDRLAYNVRELAEKDVNSPFSKMRGDWTKEAQRQVDKALKTRLDEASIVVPEAKDLVTARANYAARRAELDQLKDESLVRFFGLKDNKELSPEAITQKLGKMTKTERDFFTKVADSVYPGMAQQVRRHLFDKMVDSGLAKGASELDGSFNPQKFLSYYDGLSDDMKEFIKPTTQQGREEFDNLITSTRQSLNSFNAGSQGRTGVDMAVEGATAGALGIRTGVTAGIGQSMMNWAKDRESVFNRLYNDGRKPPTKAFGAKTGAALGLAAEAGREGAEAYGDIVEPDPITEEEWRSMGFSGSEDDSEAPVGSVPSPGQETPLQTGSGPFNEVSVGDPVGPIDPADLEGWDAPAMEVDPKDLEGW